MLVNKFASRCSYCGKRVDPNGGVCWKPEGAAKWITAHELCVPGNKAAAKKPNEPLPSGKPPVLNLKKQWYQDDDKDEPKFDDVPF